MNDRVLLPALLLALSGLLYACGGGDDDAPLPPPPPSMDAGDGMDTGPEPDTGTPPDNEVEVSDDITADTTWTADTLYILTDKIFVTDDATLTIEAGTTIIGDPGGALIVTRGSQLMARGTASAPIVFTSGNPEGSRTTGDWAGVVLLGDAFVNKGACVNDGDEGTPDVCDSPGFLEAKIEGIDPVDPRGAFGGTDDASSCGALEYVRIEFAGEELSPMNELNGLTLGACGSGTTLSYLQVHRGKDDGIEFFGGSAGLDHVVITGASDDSLDCDMGWTGTAQFVVIDQVAGTGDNGIECDNSTPNMDAMPRTSPTLWNFTMIGTPDTRGMVLREGMGGTLRNFIVTGFGSEPADVRDAATTALWPTDLSVENSYMFGNGDFADESAADDNDDEGWIEADMFTAAERNNTTDVRPDGHRRRHRPEPTSPAPPRPTSWAPPRARASTPAPPTRGPSSPAAPTGPPAGRPTPKTDFPRHPTQPAKGGPRGPPFFYSTRARSSPPDSTRWRRRPR